MAKERGQMQEQLKTGDDISHKILYKFLHPILKFSGNSQSINQLSRVLKDSLGDLLPIDQEPGELGNELYNKLEALQSKLKYAPTKTYESDQESDRVIALIRDLKKIQNTLHHHLQSQTSGRLLNAQIRDTVLWAMEELQKNDFFNKPHLKEIIGDDLLLFFQGLLLYYLVRGTEALRGEAKILEQEMETWRARSGKEGKRRYSFQKTDFGKLVEKNLALFKPILAEKGMDIQCKTRGNLTALISASDVERVICNLLHNAAKYSYEGKARFLKVKARELQPQDMVEFSMESFGAPITEEEIADEKLFQPGYRGKFAFEHYREGTGNGLADAKEVIEAHGGTITITSRPKADDGNPPQYKIPYLTTITITLPKKR